MPADLDACPELHAHLPEYVDLGIDDVLFQAEGGDAQGEHAAETGLFLQHRDVVAVQGQVIGAGQARGAGAHDGDLLAVIVPLLRYEARRGVELLVRDELLDLVDGDGIVYVAPGALELAAAVADASADCGQGFSLRMSSRASLYLPWAASLM